VNEPPTSPRSERWMLRVLAAIQFTNIVDFMVMMPLGPQLTALFAISDAQFGLLVSAYTLSSAASGLLAAGFVDRFERRTTLLVSYAGFALGTLGCALAPGYATLLIARAIAGAFGGVLSAQVQTVVADAVPYARRGSAMGTVMGGFALATIVGVPGALWLAQRWDWHAPFFAIAIVALPIALAAARAVPLLDEHLRAPRRSTLGTLRLVLADSNHLRAFALMACTLGASFFVLPYLTIYLATNARVALADVPLVYLAGGVATFVTSRLWGRLADRIGKVPVYRGVVVGAAAALLAVTHWPAWPLAATLVLTTAVFVFVSGRLVPGMAIVGQAAQPALRGTFLSLNGAVQSASMGTASFLGGLLIGRDGAGQMTGYGWNGWAAVVLSAVCLALVGRVVLRGGVAVGPASSPPSLPPR
jgi:predicted MFS family arabinose efflux permease